MSPRAAATPLPSGRPPQARAGHPFAVTGRPVVAGVGSHLRALSPRATSADLWSSLDSASTGDGVKRVAKLHGVSLDPAAVKRLRAFVEQAHQYYNVVGSLDPVAKPLPAYYFALNLAKAFLTLREPNLTAGKVSHGASDSFVQALRYRFTQERTKIHRTGVLRSLAEKTGQGYCWPAGTELQISRMAAYLTEGVDLYSDALGMKPKMLPIQQTVVLSAGSGGAKRAWITVDVSRLLLKERGLTARSLLSGAKIFESRFQLVYDDDDDATVTYESRTPIALTRSAALLPELRREFDAALILRNRSTKGGLDYIVLSPRPNLLSMEALTFAVLHHLSNMVRYRPQQVEALRGGNYWWLFTSWVDRACENFLLSMASRISLEEHVIE